MRASAIAVKDGDTILMAEARHVSNRETLRGVSISSNNGVQRRAPTCPRTTIFCECSPRSIYTKDLSISRPH
jgi:hypothetical protein